MSAENRATLRAAIAAVRADLSSDTTGKPDESNDRELLAALDAVDKATGNGGSSEPAPKTLKEAAGKAREQFTAARSSTAGSSK